MVRQSSIAASLICNSMHVLKEDQGGTAKEIPSCDPHLLLPVIQDLLLHLFLTISSKINISTKPTKVNKRTHTNTYHAHIHEHRGAVAVGNTVTAAIAKRAIIGIAAIIIVVIQHSSPSHIQILLMSKKCNAVSWCRVLHRIHHAHTHFKFSNPTASRSLRHMRA